MASSATNNRVFDITRWYNNQESYPDLTLRLLDDTTILAHKSVLCTSNEHFQRLCAPATPRGKPKSTISLAEPADVVRVLVQTIYGFPLPKAGDLSWGFWANLAVAAENFAGLELGKKAVDSFLDVAFDMTDVDTIVHIIGVVEGSMDLALLSALNLVRKHHALILLEHEGYRDSFVDHPKLALLHIDDLLAKVKDINREP